MRHEENSLAVPAGSPTALAGAIQRLWSDPELCERFGKNGQAFASSQCTEERIFEHFRDLLLRAGVLASATTAP